MKTYKLVVVQNVWNFKWGYIYFHVCPSRWRWTASLWCNEWDIEFGPFSFGWGDQPQE